MTHIGNQSFPAEPSCASCLPIPPTSFSTQLATGRGNCSAVSDSNSTLQGRT